MHSKAPPCKPMPPLDRQVHCSLKSFVPQSANIIYLINSATAATWVPMTCFIFLDRKLAAPCFEPRAACSPWLGGGAGGGGCGWWCVCVRACVCHHHHYLTTITITITLPTPPHPAPPFRCSVAGVCLPAWPPSDGLR